jgi:hypothetical protein
MLAETLIPLLKARFSDRPFVVGTGSHPAATFPAIHPEVGDLVIQDDGDELTVYVGNFTHVHFDNVDDTLAFLEDVFADRMEFFGSHLGGGGCRKRAGKPRGVVSKALLGRRTYVWSGPVED